MPQSILMHPSTSPSVSPSPKMMLDDTFPLPKYFTANPRQSRILLRSRSGHTFSISSAVAVWMFSLISVAPASFRRRTWSSVET